MSVTLVLANMTLRSETRDLLRELSRRGYSPWAKTNVYELLKDYILNQGSNDEYIQSLAMEEQLKLEKQLDKYVHKILPNMKCSCERPAVVIFDAKSYNKQVLIGHEDDCQAVLYRGSP